MAAADRFKAIVSKYRHLPGDYGLRPHRVDLVLAQWNGGQTGEGSEFRDAVRLLEGGQNPKVRWLRQDELALGGMPKGTAIIGPITPDFPGGGTPISLLTGSGAQRSDTYHVLITGPQHPDGASYRLVSTDASRALRYTLTVVPAAAEFP
jgi:hypothetical protein